MLYNFLGLSITNASNKLEFVLGRSFQPRVMFAGANQSGALHVFSSTLGFLPYPQTVK
jgi:hypothetical protein